MPLSESALINGNIYTAIYRWNYVYSSDHRDYAIFIIFTYSSNSLHLLRRYEGQWYGREI